MKCALLVLALSLLSCAKNSNVATFTIELATSPSSGDCSAADEPLPVDVTCIAVELCSRVGTTCMPEPLYRVDADHAGPGSSSVRLGRLESASFSLDARTEATDHELSVVAYTGTGQVFATGVAHAVLLDGTPVRVRLQRADQWSCGPLREGGTERPAPRAFHAATAMPNGDVLIYGGVSGDAIDITGFTSGAQGASLERSVEVYDASEDRFYTVSVSDPAGFGRVFFSSELGSAHDADPPYRVHVFGGYGIAIGAVLRVDGSQSASSNSTGLPFVPTNDATLAESVTLFYNPSSHSLEVQQLGGSGGFAAGFSAVSGFANEDNPSLLVGGASAFTGASSMTTLVAQATWIDLEGTPLPGVPPMLMNGRAGGTSTIFPNSPGSALVWGGNIGQASLVEARAHAGELVRLSVPAVLQLAGGNPASSQCPTAASTTGFPEPTVFHTATAMDAGILIAGGLYVGATDCPGKGVRTTYNIEQPLTVFTISGSMVSTAGVNAGTFLGTIFHTATALTADEGADESVLLVGGAFGGTRPGGTDLALTPHDQVGVVDHEGATYAYTSLDPLLVPRFGHATARLPGGRILVTGGFTRYMAGTSAKLRAIDTSEVLQLGVSEPNLAGAVCSDIAFASM
ncbi:MAG: hypothetical protein IPK60_00610 [Sandaracinaceae bacterium]|nr:hypothetical protein [Sandaracinaceae bacterium]